MDEMEGKCTGTDTGTYKEWDREIRTGKVTEEQGQGDRGTATVTWTVGEGISKQGQRGKNRYRDRDRATEGQGL